MRSSKLASKSARSRENESFKPQAYHLSFFVLKKNTKATFPFNKMPRTTISQKQKNAIKFPSIQIREREETCDATQTKR
jgi:hypothetical protein